MQPAGSPSFKSTQSQVNKIIVPDVPLSSVCMGVLCRVPDHPAELLGHLPFQLQRHAGRHARHVVLDQAGNHQIFKDYKISFRVIGNTSKGFWCQSIWKKIISQLTRQSFSGPLNMSISIIHGSMSSPT